MRQKRLPLRAKLSLIGILPMIFLIYLAVQVYKERKEKVNLFGTYLERMHHSSDVTRLISSLQSERNLSFEFVLDKSTRAALGYVRITTDSLVKKLGNYDESLTQVESYTFLDKLKSVRTAIDSLSLEPGFVMDYYTSTIFRLNTLNTLPTGSYVFVQPVYKALVAQKLISEMTTYLGIISSNFYNILYTQKYVPQIIFGTKGVYEVYKSYITELGYKATPEIRQEFENVMKSDPALAVNRYIDTAFRYFKVDSTYTPAKWLSLSTETTDRLRLLQQKISAGVEQNINSIYQKEDRGLKKIMVLVVIGLLLVALLVLYTIRSINRDLNLIRHRAQLIAKGGTGVRFDNMADDEIGDLANAIASIDENHQQLAVAAKAIGDGNFDAPVIPRSEGDMLGNAIVEMKNNLQKNTTELKSSNAELERFAYVASHDLQEPLRMVSSFLHLLEKKLDGKLDESAKQYIGFAVDGAERMKVLIQDLLQYSRVGTSKESFVKVDCNEVLRSVENNLSVLLNETNSKLVVHQLPVVRAAPTQLIQLFQNLVSNAIKYRSEQSPLIEVGYTTGNGCYEFYVRDNGIGIDPKFFERIFIIFQRLHTKSSYPGTGIGLSVCKKIVERHGGIMRVESEPGKGSIFYFTIPK